MRYVTKSGFLIVSNGLFYKKCGTHIDEKLYWYLLAPAQDDRSVMHMTKYGAG